MEAERPRERSRRPADASGSRTPQAYLAGALFHRGERDFAGRSPTASKAHLEGAVGRVSAGARRHPIGVVLACSRGVMHWNRRPVAMAQRLLMRGGGGAAVVHAGLAHG